MSSILYILAWPLGVVLALILGVAAFAKWWSLTNGAASPPATGVRIWEGKPGSGKSYGVVGRILEYLRHDRRPVYTNLPLRFPVVRQYLRNRRQPELAGFIVPLSEPHMRLWLQRFAGLAKHCEEREKLGVSRSAAEAEWFEDNGRHIPRWYTRDDFAASVARDGLDRSAADSLFDALHEQQGYEAAEVNRMAGREIVKSVEGRLRPNWIPYGAVIIVDELHKWFDQRDQREEVRELLDTLSMHRHGLYRIEVLSQTIMQMNKVFRDMADEVIICQDLRKVRLIFGLRWPLPTFRYSLVSAVELGPELRQRHDVKPEKTWVLAPWLDGGRLWRFYDSFTHAGSKRALDKRLAATKAEAEGKYHDPEKRKKAMAQRHARFSFFGLLGKTVVVLGVVVLAYRSGRSSGESAAAEVHAAVEANASQTDSKLEDVESRLLSLIRTSADEPGVASATPAVGPPLSTSPTGEVYGVRLVGISNEVAFLEGGRRLQEGERIGGWLYVGVQEGAAGFLYDNVFRSVAVGSPVPPGSVLPPDRRSRFGGLLRPGRETRRTASVAE
ncbi:MAG: zonular occludens toxin domain-containing protein [Planctomycetota bacterium]